MSPFGGDPDGSQLFERYPKKKRRLLQMESSSAVLDRFATGLSDIAVVEAKTVVEGKTMAIVLTQKKK